MTESARHLTHVGHDVMSLSAALVVACRPRDVLAQKRPHISLADRDHVVRGFPERRSACPSNHGLTANEQVVVDGQYKLQPGTKVTILHGEAAKEAAAQSAQQAPIP